MENTVAEKEKKNLPWFITKIVLNVIFYIVIILLLLFSIMNINSGGKNQGFPNIFGKGFLSVQSDSMTRLNDMSDDGYDNFEISTFKKGDLLYVNVVNDKNVNNLRVGDVITYRSEALQALNSHRIVYATYKDSSDTTYYVTYKAIYTMADNQFTLYNGALPNDVTIDTISTQGDLSASSSGIFDPTDESKAALNNSLQSSAVDTFTVANFSSIKGVATGVSVGTGLVLENLQQNWLFYFVFPVLVFLLIEIFLVVKNIMDLKGHKNKASVEEQKQQMMLDLEAEKEKMRQQILAELQASNPSVVNKEEAPTADEPQEETTTAEETTENEEPQVEEATAEETHEAEEPQVEETIDEEFTVEAEEETAEPATEEAPEEAPVVEEEKVEEASQEPQTLEYVEEGTAADTTIALEPAKEAVETTPEEKTVKSTSTAKKPASGAKKATTSKGSATKKTTTGTKTTATKKATTAKAKADGEATATKAPAKKASTTTKKTNSTAAKSTTAKKTTTRKTTAAKAETKKDDVKTNKEESE